MAGTIQSAVFNTGAQALFLPLQREFNTTRTAITLAFSLRRLEGGLTGPLEGYLIHWIGPRRYMMWGWVLFGTGFILLGMSQNLYHFYGSFLLITLGQSVAGFLPIVTVLINWFNAWRGRAIAIYQLGGSIGAALVFAFSWAILELGWRETTIGVGIATILMGVPLAAVMRAKPEDYGYLPDGKRPEGQGASGTDSESEGESSLTVSQSLRDRSFWFLALSHSAGITAWGTLQVHQIPALVDIGIDEKLAAGIVSYTLFVSAAGRVIGGTLGDWIGYRKVTAVALLLQGGSVIILAYATTMTQVMIFATIFGVAFGTRGTLMTVLRAVVFGRENFSRLAGLMDPITSAAVVISPLVAAWVYDALGSYQLAFLAMSAVSALGAPLLIGIRVPPSSRSSR